MAFPTTPVLDNFNRADGAVGANWSADPLHVGSATAYQIVTNVVSVASGYREMWYNAASFPNNVGLECFLTMTTLAPKGLPSDSFGHYVGLLQQPSASVSTCDGYQVGAIRLTGTNTDKVEIYKYTDAVFSTLVSQVLATDWTAGDVLGIEVRRDGTINAYRNGTIVTTTNDTAWFHNGESAFVEAGAGGALTFDNFGGGSTPLTKVTMSATLSTGR